MMYYFVAYEIRRIDARPDVLGVSNVITPLHPLEWIKRTTPEYRAGYFTVIHFWSEIPDEVIQGLDGVVPMEIPIID